MFKKYMNNLNTSSKIAIVGLAMTVFGLIGIIPALYNNSSPALAASPTTTETATAAPTQVTKEETPDSIKGHPVRVVASSVGVDMNVVDGFYSSATKEWTLNDDKAMFGTMTTEPNNKSGQTFIYGHATQRVFGKLLNMHVGDQVEVYTSNGYKFTYTLKETEVVTPQNTGILAYTGSPRLLLQTCVGTFSENRKFFILDFTKVDKL